MIINSSLRLMSLTTMRKQTTRLITASTQPLEKRRDRRSQMKTKAQQSSFTPIPQRAFLKSMSSTSGTTRVPQDTSLMEFMSWRLKNQARATTTE